MAAFDLIWRWYGEVMRRRGASPDVARHHHDLCQTAGLIEVSQRGFFLAEAEAAGTHLRSLHDAVVGVQAQFIQHGIALFQVYFATMHVELIAKVP